jgi:hypothetical protein
VDRGLGPAHYATHGLVTTPGRLAERLEELPDDVEALCAAIRGLIIHYASAAAASLPRARRDEVRTRHVAAMLARIVELDVRPLGQHRRLESRLVGSCRDFATLFCATLRHRGIPCRVRVGFADYLTAELLVDHWLAEVWDAAARRWVRVDPEYEPPDRPPGLPSVDPLDVGQARFIDAGRAWRDCRTGGIEAHRFGYGPDETGLSVVRANLLHDLACLQKVELTPWDFWGLALHEYDRLSPRDFGLLDRVAKVTSRPGVQWSHLVDLLNSEAMLHVPDVVTTVTLSDKRIETRLLPLSGVRRRRCVAKR